MGTESDGSASSDEYDYDASSSDSSDSSDESSEPSRDDLYQEGLQFAAEVNANEVADSDWEDVYVADEWADQG